MNALLEKYKTFDHILKMGRTQLQDAVPMRLGQSFHAYASVIQRDIHRLENAQKEMYRLNMGGTAIGTAINVSHSYLQHICPKIAELTGLPFASADDLFDATQNLDGFVTVSSSLKTCAVNLSKLCNDLSPSEQWSTHWFCRNHAPAKAERFLDYAWKDQSSHSGSRISGRI